MDPITQAQEWTLRNWVATFGRRPGKLEKAFLRADKGLSEQQIDAWLEKEESNTCEEVVADSVLPRGSMHATALAGDLTLLNSLDFSTLSTDMMDLLPGNAAHNWSPVEQLQDNYPSANVASISQHNQFWPSVESYHQQGLNLSGDPSPMEDKTATSELFSNHWNYMSDSDRSSGISFASSRTWETTSTVASFLDVYSDSNEDQSLLRKPDQPCFSRRSSKASSRHKHSSSFDFSTIPEEETSCSCPKSQTRSSSTAAVHDDSKPPKLPSKLPPKADKGPAIYRCTACPASFSRKWEWKRHEDSQHDPQTYWICMLGEPAIQKMTGWVCAFCDTTFSDRGEMAAHLARQHKIGLCTSKPSANKTWTREDKLKQHLQQVHALSETAIHWKAWQYPAVQKAAWGCGYCGVCLFTWEGRLSHIAEHYEGESHFTAQWSLNLVVKGLLKQCHYNKFNIAEAWNELVGQVPSRDRHISWSVKDAEVLKRKLEFHEGTPQELAKEARMLAVTPYAPALQLWIDADSKSTVSIDPALLKKTRRGHRDLLVSASHSKTDTEHQFI